MKITYAKRGSEVGPLDSPVRQTIQPRVFERHLWLENQNKTQKSQRSNFAVMDKNQSWPEFDTRLRIKL